MKRVRFTPAADADIQRTFAFFEGKRENLGVAFLNRVDETVTRIAQNPQGSPVIVSDVRRAPILRQFRDYALWFQNRPRDVLVLACLSGRRAPIVARKRAKGLEP